MDEQAAAFDRREQELLYGRAFSRRSLPDQWTQNGGNDMPRPLDGRYLKQAAQTFSTELSI
jgi:hypothetical protein